MAEDTPYRITTGTPGHGLEVVCGGTGPALKVPAMDDRKFWDEYAKLKGLAEWRRPIPVGEMLPEMHVPVLAWVGYLDAGMGTWLNAMIDDDGSWRNSDSCEVLRKDSVTHWMGMPPPPHQDS